MILTLGLLLVAFCSKDEVLEIAPGQRLSVVLGESRAGETFQTGVSLSGLISTTDRVDVEWIGIANVPIKKTLHAGDPDVALTIRSSADGPVRLVLESAATLGPLKVRTTGNPIALDATERPAIETEPNDSWQSANTMVLGRSVYGTADDVDYLDNTREGTTGIDWFRFEVSEPGPTLVFFQLELLDRDVSANLRLHRLGPTGDRIEVELSGKDPMEIVHDRERERYSTHLSRTLTRGTYFLEVIANHPDYILRTRTSPVPPYLDPRQAVEVGLDYLLEVGDAWFAQIPREGNIFTRANNLHDTATRCTACHASSFPTEASLIAHARGYPIRSRSSMLYLTDRLANSPTPLYGSDGLYWQRFIAIPLQSQGKQGGILLDFENQVLGRRTPEFERFGPFLRAAWIGRRSLPADEINGVVPLDSKFGYAWRDWRVLNEMIERTGRIAYAQAADAIADILIDRATDAQVETLQDRIHRLTAWTVIDPLKLQRRIRTEAEALLSLQNDDGGWNELGRKPGPSAVYTTGQLTWTLLRAGYSRDDPRIARALAYLLGLQQPFGGWFQTTTHENFRTPMRETRYAVEALAEAYPRENAPLKGWSNRDGLPARLPRLDSVVTTLDDLENLWNVAEGDRARFTLAIVPLLVHENPLIRARAAACLGRLGDPSVVTGLITHLGDPSKIVWRSAAWALRRLGNQGLGLEAIKQALDSPDPATRRGAARIFAYQFSGMDQQLDLAKLVLDRVADPDLWTRLQALRTLRQWFYRTNDLNLRRRIVASYLEAMARPDVPVIRKALSEGMYILLDENLGGGVSLQKTLSVLPEKYRRNALKGREEVEREALLGPILVALESGNQLQREALLRSFDGSFFGGRTFARQPTGMIDVGNDREFGFVLEIAPSVLDRIFKTLLEDSSTPEIRRRSIQLAAFFQVPGRTAEPSITRAFLRGLNDFDPTVREAARRVVANDLDLQVLRNDRAGFDLILGGLRDLPDNRRAVAQAIARDKELLARPEILSEIRRAIADRRASEVLPLLKHPSLAEVEVLTALLVAWSTSGPVDRLGLLDTLLARPGLIDVEEPAKDVLDLLQLAVHDPSNLVKERALEAIGGQGRLASGAAATGLLLAALVDENPAIRRQGLKLAMSRARFWDRPEAVERLLALLVDPDRKVRDLALDLVERDRLAVGSARMARRLKALRELDPSVGDRVESTLRVQGFDPARIAADVRSGRLRPLSLATFRDRINPLLYQPGEDGVSCARCHATHNVLRISERDPGPSGNQGDLLINYRSALKVINRGDPESSLLLRKPRSPAGQGGAEPSSPTGLSHVGGTRWESTENPAYRAILAWIQDGSRPDVDAGLIRASADSYAPGFGPELASDGNHSTFWQTEFVGANPGYPHEFTIDLGRSRLVDGLVYVPRQDSSLGRIKDFEVRLSPDGKVWSEPVARATWLDDPADQWAVLEGRPARFVQLRGLSEVNGSTSMSAAEITVDYR